MPKILKSDLYKKVGVSESITLRFDKTVLDALREEAEQRMESVNTLLNQIVKSYVNWHKPAKNAGLLYINKILYKELVESLSEEQIKKIPYNFIKIFFKDTLEMLEKEVSVSSYISILIKWIELSGFNYRIDEDHDYIIYKIQFEMGRKFSQFIGNMIKDSIEQLNGNDVCIEVTDHLVIIKLKNMS